MDFFDALIPLVTAASAGGIGYFSAKQQRVASVMSGEAQKAAASIEAGVAREANALTHYEKIVDQLQEEVSRLRQENDELRRNNLQLEKDVLDMNRHIFDLTVKMSELQELVNKLHPDL
jgi:TolA-binding protein